MRFKYFMGSAFSLGKLGIFFLLIASIYACDKDTAQGPPTSLTRLDGAIRLVHLDTAVRLSWNKALTAWEGEHKPDIRYEIEVSSDPTFADQTQEVYTTQLDSAFIHLNANQLTHFEDYYARIRAVAGQNEARSNWLQSEVFHILDKVREINIFRSVKNHELIDRGVILRWEKNDDITSVVLSAEGIADQPFVITGDNKTNASKQIEGLTPDQEYTAQLFAGEKSMGVITFKTKLGVDNPSFINLRQISGNPAALREALESAADGATIVLKRGEVYTFTETFLFDKSVKIISEPGFTAPAHIQISSSLNIKAGVEIGSIVFEDVKLTSNINGGYVFNIQVNGKIAEIIFENCLISDHRGVVRVRAADDNTSSSLEVGNYKINNCIVQNIGDFGVSCVSRLNTNLRNVSITNSTINNANRVIYVSVNKRSNHDDSFTIANVTIYNSGAGRFYDLNNDGLFTNGLTVNNSIYGSSAANNSRGKVSININNSFMTSDVTGTAIAGLMSAGKSSAQVFADPSSGDFTIKEAELYNVGDPRWRP
ncbi:DUF5123 domain-containing protein [Sphingobacterium chuzhouense]|uniref:DUF5123 domain-containing protein n=1 Tax=Sphingobacterium chuzhouense TaxID=1742264 RepID=A0ABR7XN15_9SPHI|nr:DUF5123 domain-containing protein [Sphingobacterium chuzhouense]MBD1420565.1 DUF5123 domain-containing protein [Sphingobacterium chuzhouense]